MAGVICLGAAAQEEHLSSIETEGTADVETVAAQVEFRMSAFYEAPTVLDASTKAAEFEPAGRDALQANELSPAEAIFSSPTPVNIPDAGSGTNNSCVQASVTLRFYAAPYVTGNDAPRDFALLCDKLSAIAKNLQAKIQRPTLIPEDPDTTEQSAVVRATEKAYPPAKAVAGVMKGQIVAVDNVTVESVTWHTTLGEGVPLPEPRKVICTAKVRVVYAFSASAP